MSKYDRKMKSLFNGYKQVAVVPIDIDIMNAIYKNVPVLVNINSDGKDWKQYL